MKTKIFILSFLISFTFFGQKVQWKAADKYVDYKMIPKNRIPKNYLKFEIDFDQIRHQLSDAPNFKSNTDSNIIISIPDEKGNLVDYKIYDSQTLSDELKKNTDIRTYRGISLNGKNEIASITTSIMGLHIGILRPDKPDLILEPASTDLQEMIVFAKKDLPALPFECYVDDQMTKKSNSSYKSSIKIDDEILRTYRFAVGTTAEYSQYHIDRAIDAGIIDSNATDDEKKDVVLAAVAVTIDRLNTVYIRDFGVMLELVSNEKNVIFLDPDTDPYDNDDIMDMLYANTDVLNQDIGENNYDGGHLFSTYAGGGVSGLGIICSSNKGASVTGSNNPIGDAYDIDFVAHEVGHAFGCNHTFANSCSNNRNLDTSVEPGSGSSIMAYAGVCDPNVQWHSDDYFHVTSILEAGDFITTYATCSTNTDIGNHAPVINATNYNGVYIPKETPFMLTATATDADEDALTYCWEEIDPVTDSSIDSWIPSPEYDNGPLFRSYSPTTTGTRFFPSMSDILAGTYSNDWEVLPGVDRSFDFAVTVRDNHVNGGQTPIEYISFQVDSNAGPFRVTNMSDDETWDAGETKTITWDVAGTNENNVNCATVDILFSADNGITFPVVVAENIPNNGSADFTVPGYQDTYLGRFMIKSHDNYFFNVAKGQFTIQNSNAITENNISSLKIYPNPVTNYLTVSFKPNNLTEDISIKLIDLSGREVYSANFKATTQFYKDIYFKNIHSGIYFILIENGDNTSVQKLIFQ